MSFSSAKGGGDGGGGSTTRRSLSSSNNDARSGGGGVKNPSKSGGVGNASSSGDHLGFKAMLYSQLEVLRRSKEDFMKKEEKLRHLQSENEILQLRLSGIMERRRRRKTKDRCLKSFLELNNRSNFNNHTSQSPNTIKSAASSPPDISINSPLITQDQSINEGQEITILPCKENIRTSTDALSDPNSITPSSSSAAASLINRHHNNNSHNNHKDKNRKTSSNKKNKKISKNEINNHRRKSKKKVVETKEIIKVVNDDPFADLLVSPHPYYTFVGEDFVRCEKEAVRIIKACAVEVPAWRILNVPRAYSMEGTEDIEDETFLKRHSKLENDEKKRKRWDIQRIRQQRQVERLRARYDSDSISNLGGNVGNNGSSAVVLSGGGKLPGGMSTNERIRTILPDPFDITHILVSDKNLPVTAFGQNLPAMPISVFSFQF